jgi:uncharacterized membrane protein (UPF0127 family)
MRVLPLLAAAVLALPSPRAAARPAVIPLTLPSGKVLQTEVMVKPEDLQMGLMYRPSLPLDHGMLFLFGEPDFHTIWMANCKFPIDILWLDESHKIVSLSERVPPCTEKDTARCPIYTPMQRGSFVVELNAGQARREKALVGAAVTFTLPE